MPDDTQPERADSFEAVTCPACARVHLINRKTGKTLGDKNSDDKSLGGKEG